jgi:tetratricopeptide (TPR) repeat protein
LLHEQGRTQQAAEVYRRALARVGPDPLLLYNQGVLLEDLGDPAAALAAYQSAIAEDPDLADCHYNLARLYESLGDAQHAIRHLGQYRRLVSADLR